MGTLLIKNGTVVTASETYVSDIFVADEKIQAIGKDLQFGADKTIDASACYVFPGGIDAHTHLDMPVGDISSSDSFETGTLAALHGGTTTVIDFAIQGRGESLRSTLETWQQRAAGHSAADFGFHMAVTDVHESVLAEIGDLIENQGVSSFKVYMAYKGTLMLDDRQIFELLGEVSRQGGIVGAHCENGDLIESLVAENLKKGNRAPKFHCLSRPEWAEVEATGRFIDLAFSRQASVYVAHMTAEGAVQKVRQATLRNQKVFAETCIQYLLLDESLYDRGSESARWVLSPPLRQEKDRQALWSAINQNLIHWVATDHCPFTLDQKKRGEKDFSKIPNGIPGIEHRMELLFSEGVVKNRISLNKFVDLTSTAPARLFGLFPKKGTLAVGSDADLVVFDPRASHTLSSSSHHMRCDYSAYEGWKVIGQCRATVLRGTVAVENGKTLIGKGLGRFVHRSKLTQPF